ncbi:MAG: DUF547 domain-containing protein, partial [Candidatus Omnitrophica bacterium]|nr:DUF547 domain-containing protein [Candidatus Omnitrophota bacterium]
WLNVYNATIMKTVIDHYPISPGFSLKGLAYPKNSIQQIANVWDKKSSNFLGKPMSPNNIENDTLRKEFHEPRIHFALVCASAGCPPIRNEAYTSERLDTQLEDQVSIFLSDINKNRISGNTIEISKIFKWFEADFGGMQGVKSFIGRRKPDWKIDDSTAVRYLDYDWSLNEL